MSVTSTGTVGTACDPTVLTPKPPPACTRGDTLLTPPSPTASTLGPMELLYLFENKSQQLGLASGERTVQQSRQAREDQLNKMMEELRQAMEASQHHSFWDDVASVCLTVAKVAAVVASIALAVCTCGAGTAVAVLAIAAAVLSTAAVAQGEFHVLEKMGMDSSTAGWVGLTMAVLGAVCSLGMGLATTGAEAGAQTLSATQTAANTTGKVASVASAAGHIAGGAAKMESGFWKGSADDHFAEAKGHEYAMERMQRFITQLIEDLQDASDSSNCRLGHIQGAIAASDAAYAAAVRPA